MSEVSITVSNLSKAYRIGLRDRQHDTLGSAIASWVKSPILNFKKLKNLSDIRVDNRDPDIFWALRDITFEVKLGEVLGIIGKNGAGKSTLLKILSRITEPTTGRVEIFGRVASLLEVGTGFNPELTGRENVYLNGTILGMTKREIDRKFDEIISFSGVEKFIETPVKRYSSGMKVRLAFAVAAHLDPEILIIDEVLAVGDAEFQKKCLGKMQDVSEKEGRTVLFVSHDMSAVSRLCGQILVIENGMTKFIGDKEKAINHYLINEKSNPQILYQDEMILINEIVILDSQQEKLEFIPFFSPFALNINLVSAQFVNEFDIDIVIRNRFGTIITNFSTILLRKKIPLIEGVNILNCDVNNINLAPETYTVDVHIFYGEDRKAIKLQNVINLSIINSEETQIRNKFRSDWYGYVIISHNWRHN